MVFFGFGGAGRQGGGRQGAGMGEKVWLSIYFICAVCVRGYSHYINCSITHALFWLGLFLLIDRPFYTCS